MRVKQVLLLLLLILIFVLFNNIFFNTLNRANDYFSQRILINEEKITPQKLFDKTWKIIYKDYYDPSLNHQDWVRWKNRYENKIKTEDDAKVAIDTIIASLNEPYTRFMSAKEFEDLIHSITSKIYGIGVSIHSKSGKIEVFNVIPSTPADFAGIKQGDIISAVNGKSTKGLNISEVATLVRGPENSIVEIEIIRDNKKILKKIKRKEIKIKNVKSSMLNNNIGYIQIISFMGGTTPNEFLEALENTKNAKSLIIDLRGNTGGLLDNAIFIANIFIEQGKIVDIIYRNGNTKTIFANSNSHLLNKPTVILINGASASASEILSGALKDYKKAKLIGKKTFGKGLVQKVIPLPNSTGLNLTIAKYLTPNGTDINKLGIIPDIEIGDEFDMYFETSKNDIQLETAKNILSK